ncbi:MAG TPA: Swt1 family HEPN domain-containing protein [bacterium]|jgi:hypothetical protein|nr:Swt1 family HEPN domain-containing protein [bacterium]
MTLDDARFSLFLSLGQLADRQSKANAQLRSPESLLVSDNFDLAEVVPDKVKNAVLASEAFRLFFVFENYLRELVLDVLSEKYPLDWWDRVPQDVRDEVSASEKTEETKEWMALGTRDKLSLTTYPQIFRIIESRWREDFEDVIRDKTLIQQARMLSHLRNATCHMTVLPTEEIERVRQVLRDWFRIVSP